MLCFCFSAYTNLFRYSFILNFCQQKLFEYSFVTLCITTSSSIPTMSDASDDEDPGYLDGYWDGYDKAYRDYTAVYLSLIHI